MRSLLSSLEVIMTCMVRQLQSTAQGIPLEIYCFTRTTVWAEYERIQGDVFDYLLAVMPEFGLSLYQQPSGSDMRAGLLPGSLPQKREAAITETIAS